MIRPTFLALFFLAAGLPLSLVAKDTERPNFVIIFLDDVGYGDFGCYGNKDARTPNIDRLAKQGTRFTSFYAQTVCGPSRGALMTGRQPHRIGGGWKTNADEVTIAEILQASGYRTGCVGKWDMSQRRYQEDLVPNAQGFESYFGPLGANDGNKVTLHENRRKLETTDDMAGLSRLYTDKAIEFLGKQGEAPFFLYLAHTMMHVVIDASPEFRDRTGHGIYADTLEELDHEIGRLLDALKKQGLAENTLVLLTSDNGPWSNDVGRQRKKNGKFVEWTKGPKTPWGTSGPLRGAKGSTWEGGMRVPGIIRWPDKVAAGKESDAIFSTLDVLPTFARLAGAESRIPTDRVIDGVNQVPLLLGKSESDPREILYYHDDGELQAVRKGPWKLRLPGLKKLRNWPEFDRGTQQAELYHLGRDLGETTNLADKEPEVVRELTRLAAEEP
ncbi:N-acetylgalactosamine-6-sulfatase [Haloferula helveola]|uniref:N-acetylgalactosamine-6-sulfatase n=1 Tax=Haloferula helveola TaxID=490095 RepID=A0ABM7REQ4_9BACT|nr:N-acetylgalactosamine-6-sulfatase [Haloferula helveola]